MRTVAAVGRIVGVLSLAWIGTSCPGPGVTHEPIHTSARTVGYPGTATVASGSGFDSVQVAEMLASSVALFSSGGFVVEHGRTDVRRLVLSNCDTLNCAIGPLVRIVAANGSHEGDRASLAAGKVVAMIATIAGSRNQVAYPKFALAAGDTVYIRIDSAGGRWRQIYVPAKIANWRMTQWRETFPHEVPYGKRELRPRAKFLWSDVDDEVWVTCKEMGCCAPPTFAMADM